MKAIFIKAWALVKIVVLILRTRLAMWIMPAAAFMFTADGVNQWVNFLDYKIKKLEDGKD